MNKYGPIVTGALDIAQAEMMKRKNPQLTHWHLLFGLLKHSHSVLKKAFGGHVGEVKHELSLLPSLSNPPDIHSAHSDPSLSEWLTLAGGDAAQKGDVVVTEQHVILHIPQIFKALKWDFEKLKDIEAEDDIPSYLTNLNNLAAEGKLDPVIGRSKEIRAVMEILGRRSKNNPMLVGPAGVGKTAIIEGLAGSIFKDKVPDILKGKTIYSLDMGLLMAGTKFQGEFEERITKLLKFIKSQNGEAILFIDEIHQIVGAGKTQGAMDGANLLKPALARGDLHCVGATTPEEYQKFILSDPALERRFREVPVYAPSKADSVEILMGLKEKLEIHHGVKISEEAIFQAVFLSDQYITNKNLPDKAIDLIDEASSALKLSAEAMPAGLVELESEIRSKRIFAEVNPKIADKREIDDLESRFIEEKKIWEKSVADLKRVSGIKNQLDRAKFDLEQAERKQDYELAGQLKYSLIPELENSVEESGHRWVLEKSNIAEVISRQSGIPVEKILKSKQDNILLLSEQLKASVLGQDEAIDELSSVLKASYAGLSDETRPLGSFLLIGPSGVGKTETAKKLAEILFNSEANMVRFDMSEFAEKHAISKLIGAPAGYIGHDEGGVLTEAIRQRPYSVILFDEIEKAHYDFSNILLQILDDGRLSDNKGRVIDFKNTVILMTTNSKDIEKDFRPEALGRIDAKLYYNSLGPEVMQGLVKKELDSLNKRLESKGVNLGMENDVVSFLCERGLDSRYGARPLANVFSRLITRPLSEKVLRGELNSGEYIAYLDNKEIGIREVP